MQADGFQPPGDGLSAAVAELVAEIRGRETEMARPLVVALDGGSGAGKSTLAAQVARALDVAVVPLDDFFAAEIPDGRWDEFTIEEKLARVFDWQRVRRDAIEPLLAGKPAMWYAFDFEAGLRADGTYGRRIEPTVRAPAAIILLEGAYAAGPALADLIDLAALVDVPIAARHRRIAVREDAAFLARWHQRWDEVELYYATQIRPRHSYDLVLAPNGEEE